MNITKSFGSALSKSAIGLAATCLLAGAAVAANEPTLVVSPEAQSAVTMQKQVRYGDLDLGTEAGRSKLEERIRFAASDVCDGKNVSNVRAPIAYLNCYSVALRDARAQLNQRMAATQSSAVAAVR